MPQGSFDPSPPRPSRPSASGAPPARSTTAALTHGQIDGLVRLLADDDPRISEQVRGHLLAAFDRARPILERHARGAADARLRIAASDVILEGRRQRPLAAWDAFASRSRHDLEEGAFLIAAVEYPDLDPTPYRKLLDDGARVVSRRLTSACGGEAVMARIHHVLFHDLGLDGNRRAYYEPENSYLPRVLDRKLGIPISLSVIAMLLARRIGFDLAGIGFPGHFLLRYRAGRRDVLVDAFHRGRVWTIEDCIRHLEGEGHGFRDELLAPLDDKAILVRSIANLVHVYDGLGDEARLRRMSAMLAALA